MKAPMKKARLGALLLVFCLLLLPGRPARAARPSFPSLEEACAYVRVQGEARPAEISLVLSPEALQGWSEDDALDMMFDALCVCSDSEVYSLADWDGGLRVTLTNLVYRDGVRMLDAHARGDDGDLNDEERRCLALAEAVAAEICAQTADPVGRELAIHDYLCDHIAYRDEDGDAYWRLLTTCSGLLDGTGNCQAYSDAFYLLGRLCGLEVDFAEGEAEGEGHMWNTICLDGVFLMVDVTYDDLDFGEPGTSDASHLYFNCAADLLSGEDRVWFPPALPMRLAEETPHALTYFNPERGGVLAANLSGFFRVCEDMYARGARGAEGLLWNCVRDEDQVGEAFSWADLGDDPDAWYMSAAGEGYTWVIAYWGK